VRPDLSISTHVHAHASRCRTKKKKLTNLTQQPSPSASSSTNASIPLIRPPLERVARQVVVETPRCWVVVRRRFLVLRPLVGVGRRVWARGGLGLGECGGFVGQVVVVVVIRSVYGPDPRQRCERRPRGTDAREHGKGRVREGKGLE
jgi:hypothetical protein